MPVGDHSAAASAGGYLYQVRWALLNLLREAPTRPDEVLKLEMHDDVSWEDVTGTATELLQTKLHKKSTLAASTRTGVVQVRSAERNRRIATRYYDRRDDAFCARFGAYPEVRSRPLGPTPQSW